MRCPATAATVAVAMTTLQSQRTQALVTRATARPARAAYVDAFRRRPGRARVLLHGRVHGCFDERCTRGSGGPAGKRGNHGASTLIQYYAENGRLLYSSFVAASPGDATISFLGIVFNDARIASVRITTGRAAPGGDDDEHDVVVMDDFLFGEPQPLR